MSRFDVLNSYVEHGVVLVPVEKRRPPKEWREVSYTNPADLARWVAEGREVGVATGRWARQVAMEVREGGHLVVGAWARGREVKTWEYLSGGSHFFIYRLPEGLVTRERATFYSEQDHANRGQGRTVPSTDLRTNNFTPHARANYPAADARVVVWGDGHAVPLPSWNQSMRFTDVRPPHLLAGFGGIPTSPNWMNLAIEANTYPVTKDETFSDDMYTDVGFFLSRNVMRGRGRVVLRLLYETYIKENSSLGYEPRSERDFYRACVRWGFPVVRGRHLGQPTTFITEVEALPNGTFARRLRG